MNEQTTVKRRGRPPKGAAENIVLTSIHDLAQMYAERVWAGQSVDVPRHERIERVRKALEGQGLSMEGVVL